MPIPTSNPTVDRADQHIGKPDVAAPFDITITPKRTLLIALADAVKIGSVTSHFWLADVPPKPQETPESVNPPAVYVPPDT